MNKTTRILRNIAIGLAAFASLAVIAALLIVRTGWFREYVREKIITATEGATGGKVEIDSFAFEWTHLRATVINFVIHGNEPSGAAPFVRASRVEVDLRLFTSLTRPFEIAYLGVDRPQANIIVFPDGRTNIPAPKKVSESRTTALETVVDLAIGHFQLTHGQVNFNSRQQALDIRGNNLLVQLWYSPLNKAYRGQLSLQPLYVLSGRNTPVTFRIALPVTLQRDRIELQNASVSTSASIISLNGSIEKLSDPKFTAHINGRLALADFKNLLDLPLNLNARNVPSMVELDANGEVTSNSIEVAGLRVGMGASTLEASGTLKDPRGTGSLQFKSDLALGELGRLTGVSAHPGGKVLLNGKAALDANNNYRLTGNIAAQDLSFEQGKEKIRNINFFSAMRIDPHFIRLDGLRLAAFGGELDADASLEDFARYRLDGNLKRLDLKTLSRILGQKDLPYTGVASGAMKASGDLKVPGTKSIAGQIAITISPGRTGVPVAGRLNANYTGASDDIYLRNSYISLPHTRVSLNGSLEKRLNIAVTTRDLADILAAARLKGQPPVALNGGRLMFTGDVTGSLNSPRLAGHLAVTRFSLKGRQFDALSTDLSASSSAASVSNGNVSRGSMSTQFAGEVGLKNWSPTPNQRFSADVSVGNGDLADILAMGGEPSAGFSGALSLSAHAAGTLGNPIGTVNLVVANGTLQGEAFDRIETKVTFTDQRITIPVAYVTSGAARVNLTADYQHPRDSLSTGNVRVHVDTNQVDLSQSRILQTKQPNTAGQVQLRADVTGNVTQTKGNEFLLTGVDADATLRALRFEGQSYGDLTAHAKTSGQTVSYNLVSDFAGSAIRLEGRTQLSPGYSTNADASITKLPIERVLAVAKRTDIPAKGSLSGTARFAGALDKPEGAADLTVSNAVFYNEPIDHLRARVNYLTQSIEVQQFELAAGNSRIELTARYDHSAGTFRAGDLRFQLNSNRIDLSKIRAVQTIRPGLGGVLQLTANGAAALSQNSPPVIVHDLQANISASGIFSHQKQFGDLALTANATAGKLNFALKSNLANAAIEGHGAAQLATDYPINAQLTFKNVLWSRISDLLGENSGASPSFEAAADGQVSLSGPVMKVNELHGAFQMTRLQFNTIPNAHTQRKPVVIQNQGPIEVTLDRGVARIASLRINGPETDLQAGGTFSLQDRAMNLNLSAKSNLGLLQNFDSDVTSAGSLALTASVRGTKTNPLINGKIELHDVSFNTLQFPNGISNANGVVVFNGRSASVQNLTGESGGGKITVAGFAAFRDGLRFGLRVNASNVRVRPQQGVSIVGDANINVTGTTQSSLVSGNVTIQQVTYAPQSDFGSILSRAAPPVQSPAAPSPLLDNMKLDVRIRTSTAMQVQASLAQNLQSDADLQVRGTASEPSVLGRVTINEGQLTFFGSTYTVNSGTIGFYNPVRIEPILNLSLETQAQGVDVVLTVTGPIDNMKLTYTSDPPLQFQEIVSLLASGKTPTSDPTLLANQPAAPQQSVGQMGESALVGAALADPVANRLQRVFGISQLKVDPTFTSGSELPQARLTLQQQVSSNVTFTYVTALDDPNTQIIRAEWAFNPRWSAVASRDQNGIVSLNFFYKKQFR